MYLSPFIKEVFSQQMETNTEIHNYSKYRQQLDLWYQTPNNISTIQSLHWRFRKHLRNSQKTVRARGLGHLLQDSCLYFKLCVQGLWKSMVFLPYGSNMCHSCFPYLFIDVLILWGQLENELVNRKTVKTLLTFMCVIVVVGLGHFHSILQGLL